MSAAHTPGPWQAHHDHGWLVVESDCGALYVKVEKGSAATKHMADARLIAAAPSLLAALQRVAALNPNAGEIGAGMLRIIVGEARAAIAKATGGAL